MPKLVVIYVRFSSDLQREDSCEDQQRKVREYLDRIGIDHSAAEVIRDEAVSGTNESRAGFMRLQSMVRAGQVGVVAVDDQSRLTRGDNVVDVIKDFEFNGARFISVGEGIDTNQENWHMLAGMTGLHHATSNRETGRRVRRGQEGRVLDQNGSAGDYPYGYSSDYQDSDWAEQLRRGRKPKRVVIIDDEQADVVREVFRMFVHERLSIRRIASHLTDNNVAKGRRSSVPGWHYQQVRRMLGNEKYIGRWIWGATQTKRDSGGRKKQVPVKQDDVIVQERSELRIVDDALWRGAQRRLAELHDTFRQKPGQKKRGPKRHPNDVYPTSLLGGLIYCGRCGARLHLRSRKEVRYLACSKHQKSMCSVATSVPVSKAEELILSHLADALMSNPEWMKKSTDVMRGEITRLSESVDHRLASETKRLNGLDSQIDNLVDAIAKGADVGDVFRKRIASLQQERDVVQATLDELEQTAAGPAAVPDDEWIEEQMRDLATLLNEDTSQAALALRDIIGRIEAHEIIPPGKKRGYMQLGFELKGSDLLCRFLRDRVGAGALGAVKECGAVDEDSGVRFVIDLGAPTRMDRWAPKIDEMRQQGIGWKEIGERTGLGVGNACTAWKRWKEVQGGKDAA